MNEQRDQFVPSVDHELLADDQTEHRWRGPSGLVHCAHRVLKSLFIRTRCGHTCWAGGTRDALEKTVGRYRNATITCLGCLS